MPTTPPQLTEMMMMNRNSIPSLRAKRSNLAKRSLCLQGKNLIILAFISFVSTQTSFAQTNDFQSWASVSLKSDISKKFSASLQTQLRMKDNSTQPGTVFFEPTIGYKLNKYLKIGAAYRFSLKMRPDNINTTAHRYNIDLEGRKKFGELTLKLRTRFQKGFTDLYRNENRQPYSYPAYNRNKLSIDYEVNKVWSPYIEFELFLPLNNPEQRRFDRYRATVGSSINLKKGNELDFFFRVQHELNTADPETAYIIGIGYAYNLKLAKKKNEKKDEKTKKEKQ